MRFGLFEALGLTLGALRGSVGAHCPRRDRLLVQILRNREDNTGLQESLSWEALAELLTEHNEADKKDGLAIVFAELDGTRAKANVRKISALVFDLDDLTQDVLLQFLDKIVHESVIYSTFSHTEEKPKIRLVVRLSRDLEPSEFFTVWDRFKERFGVPCPDSSCRDSARLYYLPTHKPGSPFFAHRLPGAPLDVDELLGAQTKKPIDKPQEVETATDLGEILATLRAAIRRYSGDARFDARRELLQKIIDQKPLAEEGARDVSINKACSLLAFLLPSVPWSVLSVIVEPCIRKMPGTEQEIQEFTQKAARCFARAAERQKEQQKITEEARKTAREVAQRRALGVPETALEEPSEETPVTTHPLPELATGRDGKPTATPYNLSVIFELHPAFGSNLAFNQLKKCIEIIGGPLKKTALTELCIEIAIFLDKELGITVKRPSELEPYVLRQARKNTFNPISDYLLKCGETWDGKPRVDDFFKTYLNAEISDTQTLAYVQAVSRVALLSAVRRGIDPGAYVKTVPILESPQDYRKSSAIAALFGPFFTDAHIDLKSKDSTLLVAANWCVEIAELDAFGGRKSEEVKAFISRQADQIRVPYGRIIEEFPRQAVFWGSVNPGSSGTYLNDETGNSRFMPVRLAAPCDVAAIKRDREQILGEALHRVISDERHWLEDAELKDLVARAAQERNEETPETELVLDWYLNLAKRPESIRSTDVALHALQMTPDRVNAGKLRSIVKTLKALGFEQTRQKNNGQSLKFYRAPDNLRLAPQRGVSISIKAAIEERKN